MTKHRFLWLFIFGLSLLLAACGGGDETPDVPSASPTSAMPQVRVTVAEAPVFAEPSSGAEVIINLFEGDLRRVVGQSAPDVVGVVYYQVDLGNRTGWIAQTQVETLGDMSLVSVVDPTAIAATAQAQAPTATPSPSPTASSSPSPTITPTLFVPVARVNVSRAVVFTAPSRSAEVLVALFEGEQFTALSITQPNDLGDVFYEIELGDQTGWVLSSQVELLGDAAQLAVIEPEEVAPTITITPTEDEPGATVFPTNTSPTDATQTPGAGPTPTLTVTPLVTSDSPLRIQTFEPPPLSIDLPANWEEIHVLVPVASGIAAGNVAMSVYEGPLPDGLRGTVWIVWGFPNIVTPPGELNLWADGLQLLRGLLFNECNIGIDTRREYTVGGEEGEGTIYSAVDCPEGEDVAGWFAVLRNQGGNYAFFTGVQPVERVNEGVPHLETILDSVVFDELPGQE